LKSQRHGGRTLSIPAYEAVSDEFLAKQRMLVIAPHADDESFGCAGTMARITRAGGEVYCVVASVGDLEHYSETDEYRFVTGSQRVEEFSRVMEFLKVNDWDILFRETELHERLDTLPRRRLIELIERDGKLAMDKIKPTLVAIPAISYNQDHEAVFRAAHTACRRGSGKESTSSRLSWPTIIQLFSGAWKGKNFTPTFTLISVIYWRSRSRLSRCTKAR
jgi:LmbE family N-acetylglucosaminyl deacetylase